MEKLAEAIPGMETLNPSRGQIVDDNAPPEEPVAEQKVVNTASNIKVHSNKKADVLIPFQQYFQSGYVGMETQPMGRILENIQLKTGIIPIEEVFIDMGSALGIKVGDQLVAFSQETKVYHPMGESGDLEDREVGLLDGGDRSVRFGKDTREPMGVMVEVHGYLKVTEVSTEISKAVVVEAFQPILKGDFLVPFPHDRKPMISSSFVPPRKNLSGYIVAGKFNRLMMSTNDIVYIDIGKDQNVQNGDRFEVYHIPKHIDSFPDSPNFHQKPIRKPRESAMLARVIGELVVVETQKDTATAIILTCKDPILPGHKIRSKQ